MARPLRIEFPGAWYHVMNRGRRSEKIFLAEKDYRMFVDLLEASSEMWNIRIAAYCLMPNHYHLLLQTPEANVSRAMRHINGVYTQRFNRKNGCDGQLFRGRYKSILVSADAYLLKLIRYIHRNPLKAGMVEKLEDYPWSSHKGYLSISNKWNWLYKEFIYSLLDTKKHEWIKRYRQFMFGEDDREMERIVERKTWPVAVGPKSFVDWVKGTFYELKTHDEVPQSSRLRPPPELIVRTVCDFYGVAEHQLRATRRGIFNEPRNAAVYMMRKWRRESLSRIGSRFGIEKYSSVSSAIERLKHRMQTDKKLKDRMQRLNENIRKSHEQT